MRVYRAETNWKKRINQDGKQRDAHKIKPQKTIMLNELEQVGADANRCQKSGTSQLEDRLEATGASKATQFDSRTLVAGRNYAKFNELRVAHGGGGGSPVPTLSKLLHYVVLLLLPLLIALVQTTTCASNESTNVAQAAASQFGTINKIVITQAGRLRQK